LETSASLGFIEKQFVTKHGHINVKPALCCFVNHTSALLQTILTNLSIYFLMLELVTHLHTYTV